jgi:hypothetical protein
MSSTNKTPNKNLGKKYVTIEDGIVFRKISKEMSDLGYSMNHATARNILISGIKKIIKQLAIRYNNKELNEEELLALATDQGIHNVLGELLFKVNEEIKNG